MPTGGEEAEESSRRKHKEKLRANDGDLKSSENLGDVDIRMPPGDVDIRIQIHQPCKDGDKSSDERSQRKSRYQFFGFLDINNMFEFPLKSKNLSFNCNFLSKVEQFQT